MKSESERSIERVAYSVPEASIATNLSQSYIWEAIKAGDLVVSRIGRRTLIPADRLREWIRAGESQAA